MPGIGPRPLSPLSKGPFVAFEAYTDLPPPTPSLSDMANIKRETAEHSGDVSSGHYASKMGFYDISGPSGQTAGLHRSIVKSNVG